VGFKWKYGAFYKDRMEQIKNLTDESVLKREISEGDKLEKFLRENFGRNFRVVC
jgi:hypothetical protein